MLEAQSCVAMLTLARTKAANKTTTQTLNFNIACDGVWSSCKTIKLTNWLIANAVNLLMSDTLYVASFIPQTMKMKINKNVPAHPNFHSGCDDKQTPLVPSSTGIEAKPYSIICFSTKITIKIRKRVTLDGDLRSKYCFWSNCETLLYCLAKQKSKTMAHAQFKLRGIWLNVPRKMGPKMNARNWDVIVTHTCATNTPRHNAISTCVRIYICDDVRQKYMKNAIFRSLVSTRLRLQWTMGSTPSTYYCWRLSLSLFMIAIWMDALTLRPNRFDVSVSQ